MNGDIISDVPGPKSRSSARLWGDVSRNDAPSQVDFEAEVNRLSERTLEDLLRTYAGRTKTKPKRKTQVSAIYDRDPLVVAIAKLRAGHKCEVEDCSSQRFKNADGDYFVEVHHLELLSEGGPDTIENAVCLCPTHHRFLHFSGERQELKVELQHKRLNELA